MPHSFEKHDVVVHEDQGLIRSKSGTRVGGVIFQSHPGDRAPCFSIRFRPIRHSIRIFNEWRNRFFLEERKFCSVPLVLRSRVDNKNDVRA